MLIHTPFNVEAQVKQEMSQGLVKKLNRLSGLLLSPISDSAKNLINDTIHSELEEILSSTDDKLLYLDSLNRIAYLHTQDDRLKILTWMIPLKSGTFEYFGLIQVNNPDTIQLFKLNDASAIDDSYESISLSAENWFGALYYEIIECKLEDSTYYTILGWKGNNRITTKKVIDVISIDKEGKLVFGLPVFKTGNDQIAYRLIYEYSSEVAMSISYDPDIRTIVMDHLFPSSPDLVGHYEFYGPDLSFDAFKYENGAWIYIDDYDPGIRPDKKDFKLKNGVKVYEP